MFSSYHLKTVCKAYISSRTNRLVINGSGSVLDCWFCWCLCLCGSCCLPAGAMKAGRSVMAQCCHPLSSHSVICLAPSPLQEHFPSACKMITGWLLDFPLFFSVYSPFLPSSHLLLFSLSRPLRRLQLPHPDM